MPFQRVRAHNIRDRAAAGGRLVSWSWMLNTKSRKSKLKAE